MTDRPLTIFLSAAEASGDEHAANLIEAIRRRRPDARFIGVAGDKMAAAGCEVIADLTKKAAMLMGPVLRLGYYIRAIRRIQKAIRLIRPDVHVPVDSPAMNWHLARAAREISTPVVYYIAPQVWAWGPWRVRKLARLTDVVACILPFEQRYLRDRGVRAVYVGHPLLDSLPPRPAEMPDLGEAWYNGNWRVALLPGSRPGEIRTHARALLAAAAAIRDRWPDSSCVFAVNNEAAADQIAMICKGAEVETVIGRTRQTLADSHFAVSVSGTVTMEAAHFGVPMVVFYHTSLLVRTLYSTMKRFAVPTRHFSLVNILAGRRLVPELIPWRGRIKPLVELVLDVMEDVGYLHATRRNLVETIETLRLPKGQSASDNAAKLVIDAAERRKK